MCLSSDPFPRPILNIWGIRREFNTEHEIFMAQLHSLEKGSQPLNMLSTSLDLEHYNQLEQNTQRYPNVVTMSKNSVTDLGAQVSDNINGSQIFDSGVVEIQKPKEARPALIRTGVFVDTVTPSNPTAVAASETIGNGPSGTPGQKCSSEDSEVTGSPSPPDLPTGLKLAVLVCCACMAIFALALDTTIIVTAIPTITREFKSLNDIGWYGSAYFLTTCAFQLLWGRFYTFFNLKWAYIGAIIIFETGNIVSGSASTSIALILGRAVAGIGSAAWVSYQYYKNDNATVPRRLISQRSIAFGSLTSFLMGGSMFSVFSMFPSTSKPSVEPGQLSNNVNRFPPFMLFSAVTASIGAGLITTLTPNTPLSHWCGYLALFGIGQGVGWQQPLLLAQVFLQDADVPTGTALMSGSKVLGGAILIPVSACVFHAYLERSLLELLPDINPSIIIRAGAAKLRDVVVEIARGDSARVTELLGLVEESYNRACRRVFIGALVVSSLAVIASAGVEWKELSLKEKKDVEKGQGVRLPKLWRGTTKSRDG
ncbi:hypothetical protein GMDG_06757 [Pseudogymnoascus destructans 20631-21]|uniref:Major facilitator superfamily (MFS) profile domain-containing protein n=1 Tax=Pseudogymnoascus destructans (strain ATCC MYA-4855 / 20631-21) TaxID=658429 RepID=L8FV81_PSED2|nr:hypothetical protein GMDG_06757 [Pseudogymnoascus destructans 20631-21]